MNNARFLPASVAIIVHEPANTDRVSDDVRFTMNVSYDGLVSTRDADDREWLIEEELAEWRRVGPQDRELFLTEYGEAVFGPHLVGLRVGREGWRQLPAQSEGWWLHSGDLVIGPFAAADEAKRYRRETRLGGKPMPATQWPLVLGRVEPAKDGSYGPLGRLDGQTVSILSPGEYRHEIGLEPGPLTYHGPTGEYR